jgi:hypothetical protein
LDELVAIQGEEHTVKPKKHKSHTKKPKMKDACVQTQWSPVQKGDQEAKTILTSAELELPVRPDPIEPSGIDASRGNIIDEIGIPASVDGMKVSQGAL